MGHSGARSEADVCAYTMRALAAIHARRPRRLLLPISEQSFAQLLGLKLRSLHYQEIFD
jgi:hypothetical protein